MKPVAWRWTNQFGKDVLSANRELAKLMQDKGLHVESLYASSSDCPGARSVGDVQREFYAWWEANQVDRLHGMIAQNCALAAWHEAYRRCAKWEDEIARLRSELEAAPKPRSPLSNP